MPLARRIGVLVVLLAAAAAWSGSALAATTPAKNLPANVELPEIFGRPEMGSVLTVTDGTWTNAPTTIAYQWQRCPDGSDCVDIPGAIANTYTVTISDVGSTLQVVVTARNADGDGTATSKPTIVLPSFTVDTPHFRVHYQTTGEADITETEAGDIAAYAERAYAAALADGFPAPPSDGSLGGDGRSDLYVGKIDDAAILAETFLDPSSNHGWILIDSTRGRTQHTVAHEVFHLMQFALWVPTSANDLWMFEASAEWMGFRADGYAGPTEVGPSDMALTCRDPLDGIQCDRDGYKNNGYSRWTFFEYVAERWGPSAVRDMLAGGAEGGSAAAGIQSVAAAKGTSLADLFTDWTVANMTGGYSVASLRAIPPVPYGTIVTGAPAASSGTKPFSTPVPSLKVSVDHLSARYVAIQRGSGSSSSAPCYAATLTLRVSLPAGTGARPFFWWSQKSDDGSNAETAQPLAISGSTASITVPWDTCEWQGTLGYLALPNPSTSIDAADFTVTGTLNVDPATQATATLPPTQVSILGSTVDADAAAAAAPQVEVFGPALLRVPAGRSYLRLVVSSNGAGRLQASLGSLALGSLPVRPGSNDLRFALPQAALRSLRKTSAAGGQLVLTPVSAAGATGARIVRRVKIVQPKPAKPKTKPKAKAHRR